QCHKSLWLDAKNHEKTNPMDAAAIERLDAGNEVGEAAKKLFPGGIDIPFIYDGGYQKMCDLTSKAIEDGKQTIYEASFIEDGVFIRADIMNKTSKGWDVYEVKSATKIQPYHKEDLSLQWYILGQVKNLELHNAYMITLNNTYVKKGVIDYEELLNKDCLTEDVHVKQKQIQKELNEMKKILASNDEPSIDIGAHCKKPHGCGYFDKCWPEDHKNINSVFRLYRYNLDKKLDLYNLGIDTLDKIGANISLTGTQQNQIKALELNEPIINITKLKSFKNSIQYPISYFDFETFTDAIPQFDGQRPHMQMPFQYSLHIQRSPKDVMDSDTSHFEFIADTNKDPRRAIAESMIKNIPQEGSIMAFNESFEKSCVESLAEHCPDLSAELLALNERFVDLIDPFRGGGYYHSDFNGSFSIKSILPAICPNEKHYKDLEINNGGMASLAYKEMREQGDKEIQTSREKLFEYCQMDTYAMYAIYKELLKIIDRG
ncbi:MAG: DUF2779 domain-containing protein, partial [Proteobacteria bacterium]|nr:DUF2779 domain-containing protein [Pseudomonadota bacterium]